jgi:DNA (cytosine-5)-methyltransferase 1
MRGIGLQRRGLWREYLRALEEAAPLAFVMENVPELLKSAEYADFKELAERRLRNRVEGRILNAADYRVPQTRRRAIVIGTRVGDVRWPLRTHWPEGGVPPGARPWRTVREAVEGLPLAPDGRNWHNPRNPRRLSIERYRTIPGEGEGRFDLAKRRPEITPRCWLEKPTGSTDVFGRLWWGSPGLHDSDRVLQAREGPLPAPLRASPDHGARGRAVHDLPGHVQVPAARRAVDDLGGQADRQRGSPRSGPTHRHRAVRAACVRGP